MYSAFKLAPGLQIELAPGRTTYRARAYLQGRSGYFNTGTGDRSLAEARARQWFRGWTRGDAPVTTTRTMADAARLVEDCYRPHQASARDDFLKRWHAIRHVHNLGKMDVRLVTAPVLRAFAKARGDISGSTAKKDMDTIRPILRMARDEGWITELPALPKATASRNPRVPFSRQELQQLRQACLDRDVADFMELVVLGLLRPYEALRLAAADVGDDGVRMWMHVRRKTGIHHAPVPVRFPTLRDILRRRIAAHPGRLFPYPPEWFPRRFRTLLDGTGLAQPTGSSVRPRDSWSLRATGICLEIKRQRRKRGTADYLQIARWAGTSISRIDGHYAAFLT